MGDKCCTSSTKKTDMKSGPSFSIYRVYTAGEPSIVIQSEGCCMVDCRGVLTKEAIRTVKSQVGEQVARSIINGHSQHFHFNMDALMANINQNKELQQSSVENNGKQKNGEK